MTDAEGYKPYMVADQAPFGKFGARYLVRGGKQETPEGKSRSRTVVLEFPSYEAALACYRSPGYQAAKSSATARPNSIWSSSRATTARSFKGRSAAASESANHLVGSLTLRIAATHSSQSPSISSCWALSSACCS